jgi:hypothetical protein
VGEHQRLLDMLRRRDPVDAIEQEARAHKVRTMESYEAHMRLISDQAPVIP